MIKWDEMKVISLKMGHIKAVGMDLEWTIYYFIVAGETSWLIHMNVNGCSGKGVKSCENTIPTIHSKELISVLGKLLSIWREDLLDSMYKNSYLSWALNALANNTTTQTVFPELTSFILSSIFDAIETFLNEHGNKWRFYTDRKCFFHLLLSSTIPE